jgi:hypothetical protein
MIAGRPSRVKMLDACRVSLKIDWVFLRMKPSVADRVWTIEEMPTI